MKHLLGELCEFIHQAQKERGLAALYLRNRGEEFSDDMEHQFSVVDKCSTALASLPRKHSSRIDPFLHAVNYLPSRRKYVSGHMIESREALNFYTRDLIAPAIEIVQEIAVLNPLNHPAKISAFVNFLYWKERIGLERALGTHLMETGWEKSSDLRARLEYIITEQQAYERMFLALADQAGRQAVEELKSSNDVFQRIEHLNHRITAQEQITNLQGMSVREWFELFTAKMDMLHAIGRRIAVSLAQEREPEPSHQPALPTELESLPALPLFAGLDSHTYSDILRHARVVSHAKGAMIFLEGEHASRFYVMLEGWVKLFKGNQEGQESILQLVTAGETLSESSVFSNAPFPVSAQAVEPVRLLSIPAAILREKLQNNRELAMNMLSTVTGRSQALMSQFEQLTLKTVTQRVGWFFLRLLLDSGETTRPLHLPYDKSLIAGFLGMKPETFSRTLQTLKDQGIEVDRHLVNVRDISALCTYCDMDLAARCRRSGSETCPHTTDEARN